VDDNYRNNQRASGGIPSRSMVIDPSVGKIIWHSQVSYNTWHACALCSWDASVRHMLVAYSMVVLVSSVIHVSYPLCYSHVSDLCDVRVQHMWYLTHRWHTTLLWCWHIRFTYVYHYHPVSKISMAHTWQKHMTHIYNVTWKPCGCHQFVFAGCPKGQKSENNEIWVNGWGGVG